MVRSKKVIFNKHLVLNTFSQKETTNFWSINGKFRRKVSKDTVIVDQKSNESCIMLIKKKKGHGFCMFI